MKVTVRTHPMTIFYLTDQDAIDAKADEPNEESTLAEPCFVTESMGADGLFWKTAESFEQDYERLFDVPLSPLN